MNTTNEFTYLALGDSYTIGESVADNERFPHQLVDAMRDHGVAVATPEIIARTGWSTGELINAVAGGTSLESYDLVILLVGVNDQFRGYAPAQYEQEFPKILATAIDLAGGDPANVVVLSIPDWGVTPFGAEYSPERIAAEIDTVNAINRRLSEAAGAAYVDITPISRRAAADSSLIAGDNLHPSGEMYRLWVEQLIAKLRAVLVGAD